MDRFRANRTLRSRNARERCRRRPSLRAASSTNARNAFSTIARGTFSTPPTSSKLISSHWSLLVTGSSGSTILSRQNLNQNIAGIHGTDIFGQPENPLDQAETKPGDAPPPSKKRLSPPDGMQSGGHRLMVCKAVVTAKGKQRRWSPPGSKMSLARFVVPLNHARADQDCALAKSGGHSLKMNPNAPQSERLRGRRSASQTTTSMIIFRVTV
jgi:hypothetical protein